MQTSNDSIQADLDQTLFVESEGRHGRKWRSGLLWVVVLFLIGFGGYTWLYSQKESVLEYKTKDVTLGDLTITVTATGNLEPTNQVDIGIEVSGTIESVAVDCNDRIKAGQVLARLDTTMLEAQVNQSSSAVASARANFLQAQATVLQAKSDMQRLEQVRKLSGGKIPSIQDFDSASAALKRSQATEEMARANISQAEAKLHIDRTNLEKAIIVSPINGIVLSRNIEKGQTVAASLQAPVLFTLAEDLTKMELHVNVDEADVGMVNDGQQATFTVDAYPDRTFPASIKQVRYGSKKTEGVVTYLTILEVDNSDLFLRPGMTATADIIVKLVKDALLIPNAALRYAPPRRKEKNTTQGGSLVSKLFPRPHHAAPQKKNGTGDKKKQTVWILRDSQPVPVSVTVGLSSGMMTEVIKGDITPGTPLIVESMSKKQ